VAAEILINTSTIRELIIDGGNFAEIQDYVSDGKEQYGMQTFDQHLAELVNNHEVTYEVALAASSKPSDFALKIQTFGGGVKGKGAAAQAAGATAGAEAVAAPTPAGGAFASGSPFDFLNGG
jgi:twitching motility protein PilT